MTMDTDTIAEKTHAIVKSGKLATVCESAACPNLGHCWSKGTATFMVMGERCTRRCGFCNVSTARPHALDLDEPERLANAISEMNLKHAVITSVDRDELEDCGSQHFADCITKVREKNPSLTIEVLIPDFKNKTENLERIRITNPNIINHNIETVASLFKTICPQSNYQNSLAVLKQFKDWGFLVKSGLILGLGESITEVKESIRDLENSGVRMLTIGQYLQPTPEHAPLKAYVPEKIFAELKTYALEIGITYVESGPLVRSSYHAENSWLAHQALV